MTYWFIFQKDLLLIQNDEAVFVTEESTDHLKKIFSRQHFLGPFNNHDVYCAELNNDFMPPPTQTFIPLRKALETFGADWYYVIVKAYSIINWDRNHSYCGRCGNFTVRQSDLFERFCPTCSLIFYPRLSPSIIVAIQKNDYLLMARGHHFLPGVYGLIAGFVEPGESVEDTVHRETQEEVGLKIKNLRYFGSQGWPFPDSLMMAFTADYESGDIITDHKELETADWFRYDRLPGRPSSRLSISNQLIDHFIAIHTQKNNHSPS